MGVFLIGKHASVDSGWRLLYICGSITGFFGCLIRRSTSPPLAALPFSHALPRLKQILQTHKKALLYIAVCAGFGSASYSMALVLINGLLPLISPLTTTQIMHINTYLLLFDCCALSFFGWLASRISREKLMLSASLAIVLSSMPLFVSLQGASWVGIVTIRAILVLFGVAVFAPFHARARQLVPQEARYTIISLGYSLGHQILGSPTAALSLWCFKTTGLVSSVAWYWILLGLLSTTVILLTKRAQGHVVQEPAVNSAKEGIKNLQS